MDFQSAVSRPVAWLLFLLVMAAPALAMAQRPAYHKMSALVRQACRQARQTRQPSVAPGVAAAPRASTLVAFVKLDGPDASALERHGCRVLARYGALCVAEIPLPSLPSLSLDRRVLRIEAGRSATAMMDTTARVVGALPVQQGVDLPQGYTGKGVVVGVQDIGFDLTCPNFWTADMASYRIKAFWDQLSTDTLGATLPAGRDYTTRDALLALQHSRDGLDQTHGTHTLGIAAGSGAEGNGVVSPYRGIAYDADLCLVANATTDNAALISPQDYYKYTYALDALGFKYIFDYADRVGKPCVINFSEGSYMDFRGDDALYYEMLDSLTGPGHILVASAGNEGYRVSHIYKPAGGTASINCQRGQSASFVATSKAKDNFTLDVRLTRGGALLHKSIPLSAVLAAPDSTLTDSIVGDGLRDIITATAYRSSFDPTDIVCDWQVAGDTATRAADSNWTLTLALSGEPEVDLFPSQGTFYHDDWSVSDSDHAYGVLSPGSAPVVVSVGMTGYRTLVRSYTGEAYRPSPFDVEHGERNLFSSVGPTYDGRVKPDVMAPGQNIISSYSSFISWGHHVPQTVRLYEYDGREYAWNADMGTSMSSPVVAGVIALWLQACPTLTPADCFDIFSKTCTRFDPALDYPNNDYGYGQIDAQAGMRLVQEKVAAGISDVTARRPSSGRIFSIDGRYVGRDLSRLSKGVYICDGRKVAIRH